MGNVIPLRADGAHLSILIPQYTEDGRRLHRLRQSSLKNVDICLERARREMAGLMPKTLNDANALGTAVHEAIEMCLTYVIDGQHPMVLDDMAYIARASFDQMTTQPEFEWVKAKSFDVVHGRIDNCLASFHDRVLPTLQPLETELAWGPLVLHEDDERVIELTGCIDYIDAIEGPMDWKTSGRKWQAWEHERWDIQATVYTWALEQLDPFNVDCMPWFEHQPYPFTFHVFGTDGAYDAIKVYRHEGDWAWLAERALVLARLIEADIPSWPRNDNHALCSPTWCPAWSDCKGKHYAPGWPRPSAPRT